MTPETEGPPPEAGWSWDRAWAIAQPAAMGLVALIGALLTKKARTLAKLRKPAEDNDPDDAVDAADRRAVIADRALSMAGAENMRAFVEWQGAQVDRLGAQVADLRERETITQRALFDASAKHEALQSTVNGLNRERETALRRIDELTQAHAALQAQLQEQGRLRDAAEQAARGYQAKVTKLSARVTALEAEILRMGGTVPEWPDSQQGASS